VATKPTTSAGALAETIYDWLSKLLWLQELLFSWHCCIINSQKYPLVRYKVFVLLSRPNKGENIFHLLLTDHAERH
jgi:hypothetical protein